MENFFKRQKAQKLKKFLLFILMIFAVCFFAISNQCLAMQMFQPMKIGETDGKPVRDGDLLPAKGATYISKAQLDRKSNKCVVAGGSARFGADENALWMHNLGSAKGQFRRVKFGGSDVKSAYYIGKNPSIEDASVNIYKISTDIGVTFYAIGSFSDSHLDFIVLGCKDGKFFKYIDTYQVTKHYFANNRFNYYGNFDKFFQGAPFEVKGDTIIMKYATGSSNNASPSKASGNYMLVTGQFRFKWLDDVSRFSVKYESYI